MTQLTRSMRIAASGAALAALAGCSQSGAPLNLTVSQTHDALLILNRDPKAVEECRITVNTHYSVKGVQLRPGVTEQIAARRLLSNYGPLNELPRSLKIRIVCSEPMFRSGAYQLR